MAERAASDGGAQTSRWSNQARVAPGVSGYASDLLPDVGQGPLREHRAPREVGLGHGLGDQAGGPVVGGAIPVRAVAQDLDALERVARPSIATTMSSSEISSSLRTSRNPPRGPEVEMRIAGADERLQLLVEVRRRQVVERREPSRGLSRAPAASQPRLRHECSAHSTPWLNFIS